MDKITVVVVKNPFNLSDREIKQVPYVSDEPIYHYVHDALACETEMTVSRNGEIVEEGDLKSLIPCPGDCLAVCPVVKSKVFRIVASIGLMLLTKQVQSSWFLNTAGKATFWTYASAIAVNYIGGALINHFFPSPKPDVPTYQQEDPSYGWGQLQSLTGQGNALSVTYGTIRTAGQIIAQHVTSDGDKEYLSLLLCGGEGPVDSIDDIRIDNNPIGNYKSVEVETRLGSNDQLPLSNFPLAFADQNINYELTTDGAWSTQQAESTAAQGLEITVSLPGGLYHMKDDGGMENATVKVRAQYRVVGATAWSDWPLIDDGEYDPMSGYQGIQRWLILALMQSGRLTLSKYNGAIVAAKNASVIRTYRLDGLNPGHYEVRLQCYYKSGTDTRFGTRIYWTQLSSIIYDKFSRPGRVLVGIKALATDQLSGGIPNVTWRQTRSIVNVWNPVFEIYEQKSASNPAWACYDMLHRCRKLKNINTGQYEYTVFGVPASRFDYQLFADWAQSCTQSRLEFHNIISAARSLWDSLKLPEIIGRGKVITRGTRFSCVNDFPADPVQMFTVGNMVMDKFQEEFQGIQDRANCLEITFNNAAKNYERDVIPVFGDDYNTSTTVRNPTQITLEGCVTVDQAYRDAKYRLRVNKHLIRTASWEADIDAIACQSGDVVLVQHDVPQWGYGGRLVSATTTMLTFDRTVTMTPGANYAVMLRLEDDSLIQASVYPVANQIETDTVTLRQPLSKVPTKDSLYSFGEASKVIKPFRVLNITRSQDLRRKITALEYIAEVYQEDTDVPEINYSDFTTGNLILSVNESWPRPTGGNANLIVGWKWPRDSRGSVANIYAGRPSQLQKVASATNRQAGDTIISVPANGSWQIKVDIVDSFGGLVSTGSTLYNIGPEYLLDPTGLTSYYENGRAIITCQPVKDYRQIEYEWRKGTSWINSSICGRTPTPKFQPPGDGTYWVAAVTGLVYSEHPASIIMSGVRLADNVLATYDEADDGWKGTVYGGAALQDGLILLFGSGDIDTIQNFDSILDIDFWGGIAPSGSYVIPTDHRVDIGTAALCNISMIYDAFGSSIADDFDTTQDVDTVPDVDGNYSAYVSVRPQINTAGDDNLWRGWQDFYPGQYYARMFDFRMLLNSTDPNVTAILREMAFTVDVPDRTESGANVLIPAEGALITYQRPFNAAPGPNICVLDAVEGDRIILPQAQQTKTGFWVRIVNGDQGVARHINWIAQKY